MKKNIARLTAMGTMAMMLLPMTTFAAVTDTHTVAQEEADAAATRQTEVLYAQTSSFTVTIPKKIVLDGETKAADYTVNVKGDISSDKQVSVAPQDALEDIDGINFHMVDQATVGTKKANVQADVTQAETVWSSAEVCVAETGTTKDGNVAATGLTSGSWKGTFTFNIALQNAE